MVLLNISYLGLVFLLVLSNILCFCLVVWCLSSCLRQYGPSAGPGPGPALIWIVASLADDTQYILIWDVYVIYVYIYIHMHTHIYIYIYVLCIYMYYVYVEHLASAPLRPRRGRSGEMADMYWYVWMCTDVCDYIWVCMVSMNMYGCVWHWMVVCVFLCVYGSPWMCIVVYRCLWLHGCVMDVCIYIYIYVCVCIYIHTYIYR